LPVSARIRTTLASADWRVTTTNGRSSVLLSDNDDDERSVFGVALR
jgi:hypothetical protein